jgi:hypothetical protein
MLTATNVTSDTLHMYSLLCSCVDCNNSIFMVEVHQHLSYAIYSQHHPYHRLMAVTPYVDCMTSNRLQYYQPQLSPTAFSHYVSISSTPKLSTFSQVHSKGTCRLSMAKKIGRRKVVIASVQLMHFVMSQSVSFSESIAVTVSLT